MLMILRVSKNSDVLSIRGTKICVTLENVLSTNYKNMRYLAWTRLLSNFICGRKDSKQDL